MILRFGSLLTGFLGTVTYWWSSRRRSLAAIPIAFEFDYDTEFEAA